jgi:two-component system chemotaxis response regulator CheB
MASPDHLIVIGASAGGLHALTIVLEGLPADIPAAIVVVQHLSATFDSKLPEILGRKTELPVHAAVAGVRVEQGHVYVAIPGLHLMVNSFGRLRLGSGMRVNYVRPAVDLLFSSAAEKYGARVIAVILTGYGRDGSAGVTAVRERGGTVIVQDEASSQHFGMPGSAIKTGSVQHVVPLDEIAGRILELLQRDDQSGK